MSEPAYEPPYDDPTDSAPSALNLDALQVNDVPASDEFATPNADAGRDPSVSWAERIGTRAGKRTRESGTKTRPSARRKAAVPKTRPGALIEPLEDIYTTIGALLSPFDPVCGGAVINSAHHCAETLDSLAQRNDSVRRALLALTQTSAIGAVMVAHAPIAMAVAMHHVPAVSRFEGAMGANMAEQFARMNAEAATEPPADEQ